MAVTELKFNGKYPLKMKRIHLGIDNEGEQQQENRIYMYLGAIRLDITDYNPAQIELIVSKLELMFGKDKLEQLP